MLYLERNDLPAAEQELRAALRDRPELIDAHNNLGSVLRLRGDLDGAIAEFEAALAIDPRNDAARRNLQMALQLRGGR
jgi:tetratricopeptide (TPR) repeat protein